MPLCPRRKDFPDEMFSAAMPLLIASLAVCRNEADVERREQNETPAAGGIPSRTGHKNSQACTLSILRLPEPVTSCFTSSE